MQNSSESETAWVDWFLSLKGNDFFCAVDEDYIVDRFNLTGLNTEVGHFRLAYELITDSLSEHLDADLWNAVEKSARHLYGLIHARFVLTTRGLLLVGEMMRAKQFGTCPRTLCNGQAVLPISLTDTPGSKSVRIYCPRCQDIYNPSSKRYSVVDGAYFTTSLPHLVMQQCPDLLPAPASERYVPKIFGFKVHSIAKMHRKQDEFKQLHCDHIMSQQFKSNLGN
jgi:casein kinase II subunit beta